MSKVIVDASVILACLLNEPEKDRLLELTNGMELVAPGSLPWEVGNALSAAFKKKRFDNTKAAHSAIKEFTEIPIQLIHINIRDAIDVCFRRSIYAYDAYIIVCARHARAPILTLDRRLAIVAEEENLKVLEV
jgi:predicted nucleic acid-binding protein